MFRTGKDCIIAASDLSSSLDFALVFLVAGFFFLSKGSLWGSIWSGLNDDAVLLLLLTVAAQKVGGKATTSPVASQHVHSSGGS